MKVVQSLEWDAFGPDVIVPLVLVNL